MGERGERALPSCTVHGWFERCVRRQARSIVQEHSFAHTWGEQGLLFCLVDGSPAVVVTRHPEVAFREAACRRRIKPNPTVLLLAVLRQAGHTSCSAAVPKPWADACER